MWAPTISLLTLVASAGCSSTSVYLDAKVGSPSRPIKKVAVGPLLNRSEHRSADRVFRALLEQALRSETELDVVELPPDVRLDPEKMERALIGEIVAKLELDALLTGTVFVFGYASNPNKGERKLPSVRADLRLVEAASGRVVWAARLEVTDSPGIAHPGRTLTDIAGEAAFRLAESLGDIL